MPKISYVFFGFMLIVASFVLFSLGSRSALLILWGGLFCIYNLLCKRISFKVIAALALVCFVFALGLRLHRYYTARGHLGPFAQSDSVEVIAGNFVRDFTFVDLSYMYMMKVPEQHNYLLGSSFYELPVFWIPRKFWHNKPKYIGPGELLRSIYPQIAHRMHISPTIFGEFYINFSWPGLFVGSVLTGLFYGFFEKFLMKQPFADPSGMIFWPLGIVLSFVLFKHGIFGGLSRIIIMYLLPVIAVMVMMKFVNRVQKLRAAPVKLAEIN